MKPADDTDRCSWRDLRVIKVGAKRAVGVAKALAVLRHWRDTGSPPAGYVVNWPAGKKRVSMDGMGDE